MGTLRAACLTVLVAAVSLCGAGESGEPLGSADFKPTPDRPIGFRGDSTGRFPGATPPLQWSRRVKGITSELIVQAKKPTPSTSSGPASAPATDSAPLEYFTIKDWLVCGPFDADDPAKDIEKDFLGAEATTQPDEGDKAGACVWKRHRATEETQPRKTENFGGEEFRVDFLYLYGKSSQGGGFPKLDDEPKNKAAYAHAYIYSPRDADVGLLVTYDAQAIKVWLNGKALTIPAQRGAGVDCPLVKGWNRLLVKSSCSDSSQMRNASEGWVSKWRFAAYITPAAVKRGKIDAPLTYETKNIAWMTKLTGQSMSQPIVLGDRLFLGSSTTDFLCLDRNTGKVLWLKTITHWDLMAEAERGTVKDRVEPLLSELSRLNAEVTKKINEGVAPGGMDFKQYKDIAPLLAEKAKAEKRVHDEFTAIDAQKYPPLSLNEVSSSIATAASDGRRLYWCCGGTKAFAVLCLDADGAIIWSHRGIPEISRTNTVKTRINEHGTHASPLFIDGKIMYLGQSDLIALNAKDGALAWRVDGNSCGDSPVPARIGKEGVVFARGGRTLYRVSDGKPVCSWPLGLGGDSTPIIEDGTIYISAPCTAAAIPAAAGGKGEIAWKLADADILGSLFEKPYFIASPLYVNGILYEVSNPGQLIVIDTAAKKLVYARWMDGYNRYHRTLYGMCASPTLGGKNIFIVDDSGCTTVIAPGREYKAVARNVLENISSGSGTGSTGPCGQEAFYTAPTFDGKSIYIRGSDYLYCIREK